MREFKFRGKAIKEQYETNKEWVYGFYKHIRDQHSIVAYEESGNIIGWYSYRVHGDTVGQYTDIKDKNGTEIYEGDILENSNNKRRFIVVFWEGAFCLDDGCGLTRFNSMTHFAPCRNQTIIGNIHENPELMETQ